MFKVVVIDDETIVRRGIVLETDWTSLDCVVAGEAADGEDGLAVIEKYHPDLIICDIKMPKMTGLEMLKKIREKNGKTPVIFLTAYSDFSYAQQAIHLGAADYLLKPFEDGQLEEVVRTVTGRISDERKKQGGGQTGEVLADDLISKQGDKSKYVAESIAYISENYSSPEIGICTVAENVGISEGHLSHVFKKETSYTVNDFITRYRIKAAMKLLADCRNRIYEVADKVGYRDITYFSSTFKKITGLTPSDYQDKYSQNF